MYTNVKTSTKKYTVIEHNEPPGVVRNLKIFNISLEAERHSKNRALGELEIQLNGTNCTILVLWFNIGMISISYNF